MTTYHMGPAAIAFLVSGIALLVCMIVIAIIMFRPRYGKDGYDRNGYDHFGFDRGGYDRNGYNAAGFDRNGYDKHNRDRFGFLPGEQWR